jgi:N-acetylglucosaminyldiphosphoundecaprenol N-acetyl-beta-D-mannosaminyltransferase
MAEPKYVDTLGFRIFSDKLDLISVNNVPAKVINTISPNSYGLSTKDKIFNDSLKNSDYIVLDGVYFAFASILLKGKNIKRNQGPDVFDHFLNRSQKESLKVFFLGSKPETLEKIELKLKKEYPNIEAEYYSPPFKDEFSEDDNDKMVKVINKFKPDILFVGMTCPKQEKWSVEHKHILNTGLIISIGNVFDWFAGTQKSIHPIWYKLRVAWLVRIFLRPEIFKRNIGNQMRLFTDVILLFLRLKRINNA